MSYVKTVWRDLPDRTTPVTAARLNNLESQYDAALADTLSEVVTGAGGSTGPNLILGSEANRNSSAIASDVATSVILNPGAGAGMNNIIGGDGSATVNTGTTNATTAGTNASVSVVGGYDNVAGSLSSKIISDHSYTEVGGDGHNAIFGGAVNICRSTAKFAGIFAGYQSEVGGPYSFVTGYLNNVSAGSARASGNNNVVSGTGSTADGAFNTVSGQYAAAVGNRNEVAGNYSTARGQYAKTTNAFQNAIADGQFAVAGDSQSSTYVIHKATTDATETPLGIGGGGIGPIIPINTSVTFSALIVARDAAGTDTGSYKVEGALRRGASGAPVVIGTPTITTVAEDTGAASWGPTVVAGGSTGGLNILVAGEASRTVRWVMRLTTVEVGV